MAEQSKIVVKNLTKEFDGMTVLDDISFNIEKGDFVCIVGPTGCGKTTFLNLLAKIIEPTRGEILIDGEPADPKKHDISFVFQEPSAFPWLTVEENIKFNMQFRNISKIEMERRTDEILDIIGLQDERKSYPRDLSASAEQRLVIGRSFGVYPDLLLMDEPYAQMDIKVRYYLEDEVLKLWQKTGSTVLFITHNIEEAIYLSKKCIVMTPKPTTVKAIVENPLPYPRNVGDDEFIALREEVTDMIKWW